MGFFCNTGSIVFLINPIKHKPFCGRVLAAYDAKKAKILTRESVALLLPFSNGYRRTAFRFHYGRPTFFIFKSRRASRDPLFLFPHPFVCIFFSTDSFLFFMHAARKQCHRGHELTRSFPPFGVNKNILIRHRPVN